MHAVLTVRAALGAGARDAPAAPRRAVVLVIDHSSSMLHPRTRLTAARDAAEEAVRALPDGTYFALVAGRDRAEPIYPAPEPGPEAGHEPGPAPVPVPADDAARREAVRRLRACPPGGGTAMGAWLECARSLCAALPDGGKGVVCHAVLLTDGRCEEQYESRALLQDRIAACVPDLTCDAIGIGDGWESAELLEITARLHGTAHAVGDLHALGGLLGGLARQAAERTLTGLKLRFHHREGVELRSLEQVSPSRFPMTPESTAEAGGEADGEFSEEFATAPWGDEERVYELSLTAPYDGAPLDRELLLSEVEVRLDGEPPRPVLLPPPRQVLVRWTNDRDLYSRVHPTVSRYRHQDRLVQAVEQGRAALRAGDRDAARDAYGRAWRLAVRLEDDVMKEHLRRLIDPSPVHDEVRLHSAVRPVDAEAARIQVSRTGPATGPSGAEAR